MNEQHVCNVRHEFQSKNDVSARPAGARVSRALQRHGGPARHGGGGGAQADQRGHRWGGDYIIHNSAFSYIHLFSASASKDDVLVLEEAKQGGDTADTEELEDLEQSLQVRTARIVMIIMMIMMIMMI